MTLPNWFRSPARTLIAALFLSCALVRPALATDWTDIWYTDLEVGWGVNFAQSDKFIFATFFVHGADQQPDWYTGQMTQDANGNWSGPLYRTTGSYFGGPFQSNQTSTVQVGTVTFNPSSPTAGALVYTVNGVTVTKTIARLTLTTIPIGGHYSGAMLSTLSNCNNSSSNRAQTSYANLTVTHIAGSTLQLDFDSDFGQCTIFGNYQQNGTLYSVPNAAYSCYSSSLTAQLSNVKSTAQGIEGTWTSNVGAVSAGCVETGFFSLLFIY